MSRMKSVILRLSFVVVIAMTVNFAAAQTYTVSQVPNVQAADSTCYVSDPAHILSPMTVDSLNSMVRGLRHRTSIEIAIVVVPAVEDGDCFTFAYELGRKWGVGVRGRDNGLVILLATEDRCVQFATGYGLEGDFPDALCKRIQTRYMNGYFADNNWDAGLLAGVNAVCRELEGLPPQSVEQDGIGSIAPYLLIAAIALFLLFSMGMAYMSHRRETKCPRCGKYKLVRTDSRVVSIEGGITVRRDIYICSACGHIVKRDRRTPRDNHHHNGGSGMGPIFWGGFGGFGRHSGGGGFGGFGGGGFGGGGFGGGGAGSKF